MNKYNQKIIGQIIDTYQYAKTKQKSYYNIDLMSDQQRLFLYGCEHNFIWNKAHFLKIKNLFNEFVKKNKNKYLVVVHEFQIKNINNSVKTLIKQIGEAGYLFHLSRKRRIKIASLEPRQNQLFDFLIYRKHKKIDIAVWFLLNYLLYRIGPKNDLYQGTKVELNSLIGKINRDLNIRVNYSTIVKRVNSIVQKDILPRCEKDLNNINIKQKIIKEIQDPFYRKTIFNDVGCDLNLARDYYMASKILNYLEKQYSIFGVLGVNHVVCQQFIYKDLFDI